MRGEAGAGPGKVTVEKGLEGLRGNNIFPTCIIAGI